MLAQCASIERRRRARASRCGWPNETHKHKTPTVELHAASPSTASGPNQIPSRHHHRRETVGKKVYLMSLARCLRRTNQPHQSHNRRNARANQQYGVVVFVSVVRMRAAGAWLNLCFFFVCVCCFCCDALVFVVVVAG